MLDFYSVLHAPTGKLKSAISGWSDTIKKLEAIKRDVRGQITDPVTTSGWSGEAATAGLAFMNKVTGEVGDALAEAEGVKNILTDAHTIIAKAQRDLQHIVDVGDGTKDLTVDSEGRVSFKADPGKHGRPPYVGSGHALSESYQEWIGTIADDLTTAEEQARVDALQRRIDKIVADASAADENASSALRANLGKDGYNFSTPQHETLDSAEKARKAAQNAVDRARKGHNMTDDELTQFNAAMKKYQHDPIFAEEFATELGAKGVLEFWAEMGDPYLITNEDNRVKLLQGLQTNLGTTLASATHYDSPAMDRWEKQMITLGPKQLGTDHAGNPLGFQVMSNLMRHGEYDSKFLESYGNSLMKTDRNYNDQGLEVWTNNSNTAHLNFGDPDDRGRDPMTGFMEALSHNPDASTTFFNTTEPSNNAEYVLKDRQFHRDSFDLDAPIASQNAVGNALFAASSGMDPSDENARFVEHGPEHREVLDKSLKYLSVKGDDFPPELREGMAKILNNHGEHVHHSASALSENTSPHNRQQLLEVTKQISRSQDSYGILSEGINYAIVREIYEGGAEDPKESLVRAGQTVGFLEEARYQALKTDKEDPSWDAKWGYHIGGGIVNSIPVVGDAAQRSVDALTYAWQLEEQKRINSAINGENNETFSAREDQLEAIARQWARANPDHEDSVNMYMLQGEVGGSAYDGNQRAKGLAGEQ